MKNKNIKLEEIYDSGDTKHFLIENTKNPWDAYGYKVGILVEVLDMFEATGDKEFKDYPVNVSFHIVSLNPSKAHCEDQNDGYEPTYNDSINDCYRYRGGVPIDHFVQDLDPEMINNLKIKDACLKTHKAEFGTIAAQRGKGTEFTYPMFKTMNAGVKYIKTVLKSVDLDDLEFERILDEPINMMGETGINTITQSESYEG